MNCARPLEDSHGECRESGRCRGEGKACPGLTSQGRASCLVLPLHATQAEVPVGHGSHYVLESPCHCNDFWSPLVATFSLSRLQSRSESLNGVSLHRCAGRQHTMDGDRLSMAVPLRGFTGFWDISDFPNSFVYQRGFGYMIFTDSGVTWF